MAGRLAKKVALVTGSGQGIGAAIARVLVEEGAIVIATDRRSPEKVGPSGAAEFMKLDVTVGDDWDNALKIIDKDHGRLDILINNAGVAECLPLERTDAETWRRHMSINAEAVFSGIKTCLPLLRRHANDTLGGASIVNITSVAALLGLPNQCAYNASKAALGQLSRSLAVEFATKDYNIRVNAIHPGRILTPMTERILADRAGAGAAEGRSSGAPLRRMGRPEDIAYGAVYLASDEAAFVTGAELIIDGGWTAW
jgi:NAD(P)-dependent dehydrogenase (short-subunit alcohol dehydrogenase family)